jgi:AraC-like DNA-binding protein
VSAIGVLDETDTYREFAPPASARDAIACFWLRRGDGSATRVLPDACADIVWRSDRGVMVAGPDTAAWLSQTRRDELIIGARLLPGAGREALRVPLSELRNQRVPLVELGLDRERRLGTDADPNQAMRLLVAMVTALVSERRPDQAVQSAVLRLRDPRQRIDRLAGELGYSERQLRRRFEAGVGYGPKTLQRVLRLRRFLARAAADNDLAAAAYDAGYADQPHLGRECRALTGLSPRQLVTDA